MVAEELLGEPHLYLHRAGEHRRHCSDAVLTSQFYASCDRSPERAFRVSRKSFALTVAFEIELLGETVTLQRDAYGVGRSGAVDEVRFTE